MRKAIHVAIVDDEIIFRLGLSIIIKKFEGFSICCETDSVTALLPKLRKNERHVDVCILAADHVNEALMKDIEKLKRSFPDAKILLISMFNFHYNTPLLTDKGVNGFLMRDMQERDLLRALLSVYYTGRFNELPGKPDDVNAVPFLSTNEKLLLSYLCEDIDYSEIAQRMNLEEEAVKGYSSLLFDKMQVSSRVGLVLNSYMMGLCR